MKKYGKKYKKALELIGDKRFLSHSLIDGISSARKTAYGNFDESFTVNIKLGINPEKSEHAFRGSIALPHSFGKPIKIIAFAKGEQADLAQVAGADFVGVEELIEKVMSGWCDFDYAVATPDLMGLVGKTAKILGPRGLLPNKKNNTVALELTSIIKELKSGLRFFKNTKDGHVHFTFGKKSQKDDALLENLVAFLKQLKLARPATVKGAFVKNAVLSSTMGVGIILNSHDINK
jgi:large subunit ribosomal protein L1